MEKLTNSQVNDVVKKFYTGLSSMGGGETPTTPIPPPMENCQFPHGGFGPPIPQIFGTLCALAIFFPHFYQINSKYPENQNNM